MAPLEIISYKKPEGKIILQAGYLSKIEVFHILK